MSRTGHYSLAFSDDSFSRMKARMSSAMFNGTADPLVSYSAAAGSYAGWGDLNGCTGEPEGTFANGDSSCVSYPECADGATTSFCTVEGGGHTWPGSFPVPRLGYTTTDLHATDAMWDFFVAHPKP